MREVVLNLPWDHLGTPRVARLTRHLKARLEDFGPGGPEVLRVDEAGGVVEARFPGHDPKWVLDGLGKAGIMAVGGGQGVVFFLNDAVRFEDLDYVWGCLFELL